MSLILDALRRSEAERQRGSAPGLFVEQQAPVFRRRARRPVWAFVLGGALLVVLGLFAWREFSRGDVTADEASSVAVTATGVDTAMPQADADSAPAPADEPLARVDAREREPVATVDAPSARDAVSPAPSAAVPPPTSATTALPAPETFAPASSAAPTAMASTPDAAPAPTSADNGAREATPMPSPAVTPTLPAAVTAPAPPQAPASAPIAGSALPASPPETAAPLATDDADPLLPSLAQLPAAERASLPALKVSMHVYNPDRAKRFLVVDGQRATEGAVLAPGIVVESIHRDGAVLSVNGRRLRLARP